MAKIAKTHVLGGIFYITAKGDHEEEIFRDPTHFETYLNLVKKYKAKHGFKLYAFCLLSKQVHLVIEPRQGASISEVMHDLSANYTKSFNSSTGRKGHLFHERNRLCLLEKDIFLLKTVQFVHTLPVLLGLIVKATDYPWCGATAGGATLLEPESAGVGAGVSASELQQFWKQTEQSAVLGSPEFILRAQAVQKVVKKQMLPTRLLVAGAVGLVLLSVFAFIVLRHDSIELQRKLSLKDSELARQVAIESQKFAEDLDEKYRADLVSYQAIGKRLELQRQKALEVKV